MRKISLLLIIMLLVGVYSCKNDEVEFPDFDYTTTYFPFQYPIRTLVLGDYRYDNSNDNELKFLISAKMGGTYANNSTRTVEYELDPTLVNKLITTPNTFDSKSAARSDTLRILPASYYTLSPANQVTIPSGSFIGSIEVQLNEAFLNDTFAARTSYVIPLKITSSTTDSVLVGRSGFTTPDPRRAEQWTVTPKNFTIFGIKFVNEYHGNYLRRGVSVITDTVAAANLDTIFYHQRYVEKDELIKLQTISRNTVQTSSPVKMFPTSPGRYYMNISVNSNNDVTVSTARGSAYRVSGSGKFVVDGDMWGGENYDVLHLNYTVTQGRNKHNVLDTLVFRDKAVSIQEYVPVILP